MFTKYQAATVAAVFVSLVFPQSSLAFGNIKQFRAKHPIHVYKSSTLGPAGMNPKQIKAVYNLPQSGGHGTIAIIDAYDDETIESDLNTFSRQFGLPVCTTTNGCLEKHLMISTTKSNSGWALETSLDVEWAHAIAPNAKILLMAAKTASGANLLKAIDYANSRSDVVAISMSWGGPEFADESSLDFHFVSSHAAFFASSGDNGAGVSWPAASKKVVSVGGSTLNLSNSSNLVSETAWIGSGGGVSQYETQPDYQEGYNIPKASGHRAVPDVSFNANPRSGYSVYKAGKWYVVGGTSAGAPQWAAIQSLGLSASNKNFYTDKSANNNSKYFRDIVSGSNGECKYYCDARKHYDYVTGLGSPLTVKF